MLPTQGAQGVAKRRNKLSGSVMWRKVNTGLRLQGELAQVAVSPTAEFGYRRVRAVLAGSDLVSHYLVLELC